VTSETDEPPCLAHEADDGVRPNGPDDACFYCHKPLGRGHGAKCPILERTVTVVYSFRINIRVPLHWDEADVEFHRNEGTWCAHNAVDQLRELADQLEEQNRCLCDWFMCTCDRDEGENSHGTWSSRSTKERK